ncbi:MAG: head GIN domain-containing protein [Stellaceae bacterium]
MRCLMQAALVVMPLCLIAGAVAAQTQVIQQNSTSSEPDVVQQNNVSVNGEGSSVTISGHSISVDTAATGRGRVIGAGQPASQERPIGPVTAIHSDGAFALTITSGPAPKLTIETDKNLLPIIKTTVSNGRLDVYSDQSYSVDGRIKITVASPVITEISASGSNRIDAQGFTGGPLTVALNGSNTATLAGRATALTGVLSGANHLAAQGLAADSTKLTLNGSGDAVVDARQAITAQINGAGSVTVYGDPQSRSTQVNGAGKITFAQ